MRVLILSCNTGEGHNAAGRAVEETVRKAGHDAVFLDYMELAGKKVSRRVSNCYICVAKNTPHLFHLAYEAGMLVSKALKHHKSPVYYANAKMANHLQQYLNENSFDAILMPHLYPAETITYMKQQGVTLPLTVAIATDYTCIPFWEETDCDFYIIPHKDLIEEYINRGIPKEKLIAAGIPVRESFTVKKEKKVLRKALHLPENQIIYLIMSGSMGFGKIQFFTFELIKHCKKGEHIIVICGNNEKTRVALQREFGKNHQVHILGFTNNVSDYMDASDVIFTKPGGLTSTEAAMKRIPIVHTAPIPGCESCNVSFFTKRGMSLSSKRMLRQIQLGQMLAVNQTLQMEMKKAQCKNIRQDVNDQIYQLLVKHTEGLE